MINKNPMRSVKRQLSGPLKQLIFIRHLNWILTQASDSTTASRGRSRTLEAVPSILNLFLITPRLTQWGPEKDIITYTHGLSSRRHDLEMLSALLALSEWSSLVIGHQNTCIGDPISLKSSLWSELTVYPPNWVYENKLKLHFLPFRDFQKAMIIRYP